MQIGPVRRVLEGVPLVVPRPAPTFQPAPKPEPELVPVKQPRRRP